MTNKDYRLPVKVNGVSYDKDYIIVSPTDDYIDITVEVVGDDDVEANENFYLNIYAPSNLNLINSEVKGTIINDDVVILNIERIDRYGFTRR